MFTEQSEYGIKKIILIGRSRESVKRFKIITARIELQT